MAGPRFHTRGFSERWNFPWTPPEVNGWKPALKEDMGRVCLENLAMMGVLRSVSDRAVSFKRSGGKCDAKAGGGEPGRRFLDGMRWDVGLEDG